MTIERARDRVCRCAECRALDALPARLQGWPDARQLTFLRPIARRGR